MSDKDISFTLLNSAGNKEANSVNRKSLISPISRVKTCWIHFKKSDWYTLLMFSLPITIVSICQLFSDLILNKGVASTKENLASFGMAILIVKLLLGFVQELRQVALVLVKDEIAYKKALLLSLILSFILFTIILILGFTQIGYYIIDKLHDVSPFISLKTRKMLIYLSALPFLEAMAMLHSGFLLTESLSKLVGIFSIIDVSLQLMVVVVCTSVIKEDVIWISVVAIYAGTFFRMLATLVACYIKYDSFFNEINVDSCNMKQISVFLFPLAFWEVMARSTRPAINLMILRDRGMDFTAEDAVRASAAFLAANPTASLIFAWVHDYRVIFPAFGAISNRKYIEHRKLYIFILISTAISFGMCMILFMDSNTSLKMVIFLQQVTMSVAIECAKGLKVLAFLSVAVGLRTVCMSVLLLYRKPNLILPSIIIRFAGMVVSLIAFQYLGIRGIYMGTSSILITFIVETISTAIPYFYILRKNKHKSLGSKILQEEPLILSSIEENN